MVLINKFSKSTLPDGPRPGIRLLTGLNGATVGMMYCDEATFGKLGDHEDQEGFLIIEGNGFALIDGVEYPVEPDTVILLEPHMLHTFRKAADSVDMKILYWHAAV